MKFLAEIVQFLKKPFPAYERLGAFLKILLLLSVFISLFLYIFQPFGIATIESYKFLICLGFGSMTFLGAFLYELFAHKLLGLRSRLKPWSYGKWIVDNLAMMLFISLANFLYARLFFFGYIDWSLFPAMLYGTFMIGIIPITGLGAFALMRQERKYQEIAEEINAIQTNSPNTSQASGGLLFEIPVPQIRFIEALHNYVKIGHIDEQGKFKIQVERTTLKQILEQTAGTSIVKCHRSYLVNKDTIEAASGNAQGLLLSLRNCEIQVPVSRTYVHAFR